MNDTMNNPNQKSDLVSYQHNHCGTQVKIKAQQWIIVIEISPTHNVEYDPISNS